MVQGFLDLRLKESACNLSFARPQRVVVLVPCLVINYSDGRMEGRHDD
jgi:hypothetical protein